jgi:hypothetical protein
MGGVAARLSQFESGVGVRVGTNVGVSVGAGTGAIEHPASKLKITRSKDNRFLITILNFKAASFLSWRDWRYP